MLDVGNLASGDSGVYELVGLGKEIEGVVGVVGVGYAVENETPSGGGGNDFVGAGLLGGILRAVRYRRSSSSEAYDLRKAVGVLELADRGGSESENEPPPKVTADVGVGVRDLLTVLGVCEEGVRVTDRVVLEFVGEVDERLELDGSSNAGNGEKEDLGIASCGGCA